MSPRKLRDMTGNSRSAAMLQKNVYLWFQRVERGVYQLTPQGEEALLTYAHVVQAFRLEPVPLTGETNEAAAEPIGSLSGSV